jgi:hypothetical protein
VVVVKTATSLTSAWYRPSAGRSQNLRKVEVLFQLLHFVALPRQKSVRISVKALPCVVQQINNPALDWQF